MHSLALLVLFFCLSAILIYFLKNHKLPILVKIKSAFYIKAPENLTAVSVLMIFVSVLIRLNSFLCRVHFNYNVT